MPPFQKPTPGKNKSSDEDASATGLTLGGSVTNETDSARNVNNDTDLDQIVNNEAEVHQIVNDETEVDQIVNNEAEVDQIVNNEAEVDQIVNNEAEVDQIVNNEAEVDQIVNNEAEVDQIVNDETEVDQIVNNETDSARNVNNNTDLDQIVNNEAEVDQIVNDETEVDQIVNNEAEVDQIVNNEAEVDQIVNNEAEVDQIVNDETDTAHNVTKCTNVDHIINNEAEATQNNISEIYADYPVQTMAVVDQRESSMQQQSYWSQVVVPLFVLGLQTVSSARSAVASFFILWCLAASNYLMMNPFQYIVAQLNAVNRIEHQPCIGSCERNLVSCVEARLDGADIATEMAENDPLVQDQDNGQAVQHNQLNQDTHDLRTAVQESYWSPAMYRCSWILCALFNAVYVWNYHSSYVGNSNFRNHVVHLVTQLNQVNGIEHQPNHESSRSNLASFAEARFHGADIVLEVAENEPLVQDQDNGQAAQHNLLNPDAHGLEIELNPVDGTEHHPNNESGRNLASFAEARFHGADIITEMAENDPLVQDQDNGQAAQHNQLNPDSHSLRTAVQETNYLETAISLHIDVPGHNAPNRMSWDGQLHLPDQSNPPFPIPGDVDIHDDQDDLLALGVHLRPGNVQSSDNFSLQVQRGSHLCEKD